MELSVIVTTFQRPHLLKWGLFSLSRQKINCEYEVIVLNDGTEDGSKEVCDSFTGKLPIRYIFTGHRNAVGMKWRVAGFGINIGIKQAKGKNIILTCAEMFVLDDCVQQMVDALNRIPKNILITQGKDDTSGVYLKNVQETNGNPSLGFDFKGLVPLCIYYPFFMGLNRQIVLDMGGYDEDFTGYAYDDTDFTRRLVANGGVYETLAGRVVHLYHPRNEARPGIVNLQALLQYNEKLYHDRGGRVVRNEGRDWGKL